MSGLRKMSKVLDYDSEAISSFLTFLVSKWGAGNGTGIFTGRYSQEFYVSASASWLSGKTERLSLSQGGSANIMHGARNAEFSYKAVIS